MSQDCVYFRLRRCVFFLMRGTFISLFFIYYFLSVGGLFLSSHLWSFFKLFFLHLSIYISSVCLREQVCALPLPSPSPLFTDAQWEMMVKKKSTNDLKGRA